ncbi:sulfite oxidase heme-binding subunit YedZ [Planktotalea sp.]|uniref:sulfite oxidase heme-binding subunit YedZ n=1 Tax=Planktotalea sp. TaxID=2029877 RepID=UPI003D6BACFE
MKLLNSKPFFWLLLSLPAFGFLSMWINGATNTDGKAIEEILLHPTGEFAARFMIIAMILTPMRMLFPASGFWRWMMKRRRHIGVAAFGYAAFHTLLYIVDMGTLRAMLGEFFALGIWTGWLALFIFLPLAVTSNDYSLKKMGRSWKPLQRTVYVAALATLVHWIFVHNNVGPALVHFIPLAGLETYRIWRNARPRNASLA